jgi:hypothetical protein
VNTGPGIRRYSGAPGAGLRQQAKLLDFGVHYRTARHRQLAELAQALADDLLLVPAEAG